MKKFLLLLFILVDLVVVAGAAYFLYMYVAQGRKGTLLIPTVSKPARPAGASPNVSVSTSTTNALTPAASQTPGAGSPYRNLRFTYRNSKAKQVFIRADFTGWKGMAMQRDAAGIWIYDAQLTPGEYAYCFTVDDKIIPDPAAKRTKQIAQTKVSAIIVEPAPKK